MPFQCTYIVVVKARKCLKRYICTLCTPIKAGAIEDYMLSYQQPLRLPHLECLLWYVMHKSIADLVDSRKEVTHGLRHGTSPGPKAFSRG